MTVDVIVTRNRYREFVPLHGRRRLTRGSPGPRRRLRPLGRTDGLNSASSTFAVLARGKSFVICDERCARTVRRKVDLSDTYGQSLRWTMSRRRLGQSADGDSARRVAPAQAARPARDRVPGTSASMRYVDA